MTSASHGAKARKLPEPVRIPAWYYALSGVLAVAGFGTFGYGLTVDSHRAWASYLIGFFLFLCIGLAGAFFVAVHYLTSAGWGVTVRRIPEAMSAYIVPSALLAVGVFFGASDLYHWTDHHATVSDMVLHHKAPYLNLTRMAIFVTFGFAVWIGLSGWMKRNSRRQDTTGEAKLTHRNAKLAAVFMVLFALTFSTASFDFMMSLEPHWMSTMWAVYLFAGLMQSGMAAITLLAVIVRKAAKLEDFILERHLHDLGKMVFAFTVFWAYIGISQYLLIWYANLPEETVFFIKRFEHGWGMLALAIPFIKFVFPFLVLLPAKMKHTPAVLVAVCLWILGATFVELWWIVMPAVSHDGPSVPAIELAVLCGFLGVFLATFGLSLSRHSIIPIKDPRLTEAVLQH